MGLKSAINHRVLSFSKYFNNEVVKLFYLCKLFKKMQHLSSVIYINEIKWILLIKVKDIKEFHSKIERSNSPLWRNNNGYRQVIKITQDYTSCLSLSRSFSSMYVTSSPCAVSWACFRFSSSSSEQTWKYFQRNWWKPGINI